MSSDAAASCRNCDRALAAGQAYCGGCGQQRVATRLTLHEIGHDLVHALVHVDRSVLSLVRMLLVRPGGVALDYVEGRRKRYFGPFAFLVVMAALASAAVAYTGLPVTTNRGNVVAEFLQAHVNLIFLVEVPVLAGWLRLLQARAGYTFAEHLVLAAYASSMRILFGTLVVLPAWYLLAPGPALSQRLYVLYLALWPLYFGYACTQFFGGRRSRAWLAGALATVLTWASIEALAALVTTAVVRTTGTA
jgi:hypothetical protein